ncbi:glycosyltransferase family 2 protein [Campylobacter lari]|uniref:glycosyltransferase n=1 Tax=Campylobacter lari TaxID=201 RepID=UPI0037297917
MIYKMLKISWNERKISPLRIFKKSFARFRRFGYKGMIKRLNREYYPLLNTCNISRKVYNKWIKINEKDRLKTEILPQQFFFSIVMPTYNSNDLFLKQAIKSVLDQTYINYELCIVDDGSTHKKTSNVLKSYESHAKIKIIYLDYNQGIAMATNEALVKANGEYIVFLDHDDMLAPNALFELAKMLNGDSNIKFIYSDEDKIDKKNRRFQPYFKSGWNEDLFYSQNYIGHLVCLKKDIIKQVGYLRTECNGAQDYDLLLRCVRYLKKEEIGKIDKILYHWRAYHGSTALSALEKNYTHKAGLNALKYHFKNIKGVEVQDGLLPNTYKVCYALPSRLPLVSIIIPTKDRYEILSKCIYSILGKTTYKNYEIIIVNNQSTCMRTLDFFDYLTKKHNNIRIIGYNNSFNYSAINNLAVRNCTSDIVVLLNNDIEIISPKWLEEMVQHLLRKEIGAVGAKLYYSNDTLQHGGVILGIREVAGHSHKYFPREKSGYFMRLKLIQNYSAVTGACLGVRRDVFWEVDGMDEKLAVAFNDVDFCLKLLKAGYRNLWSPYIEAYHHESLSRGADDTIEKQERMCQEMNIMKEKWGDVLYNDLYYNKNLTSKFENFYIKF